MTLRELIREVVDNAPLDRYLENYPILDYKVEIVAELRLGYKELKDVKVSEKNKSIVIIHEGI